MPEGAKRSAAARCVCRGGPGPERRSCPRECPHLDRQEHAADVRFRRRHAALPLGGFDRAGYGTPSGTYRPQRLERTWFSKEYYNSPMPHSIFFHGGYAIHGSYEIHRLGGPASHGCIRLHPANAATLFALVKQRGMSDATIIVSGGHR
jgi:L,D-transpeptidase catalytic domain